MLIAAAAGGFTVNWSSFLALAGLAGLAGGTYAFFSVAKNRGLLELYKGEADAQKARGDRIEKECDTMKTDIEVLKQANLVLAGTVSGAVAVEKLSQQLQIQHAEMMGLFTSFLHRQAEIMEKGHP